MKRFYIKLKENEKDLLINIIKKNLNLNNNEAETLIKQGSVWDVYRKKRIKDPDKIITDELITIYYPEYPIIEYTLKKENIKYEDDFFIIVYKEAGINSTFTPFSDIDSILWGVQKYYIEKNINYIVNPINRLDKPTEGLIFFAKSKKYEKELHLLFQKHKIKKLYLALTPKFDLEKKTFFIRDSLEWKGKVQEAISYIKFLKEKNDIFYFLIYPKTGRTHQIRKHFLKYLKPIIGDALYGNYKTTDKMQLYCFSYIFKHPVTNKKIEVISLPDNCELLTAPSIF